jgi:hypothetical protein
MPFQAGGNMTSTMTRTQVQTIKESAKALKKGTITEKGREMILVFASIPKQMIQQIMKGQPG